MATRHEITSIQFKADAGKANAAIDSIRQKAKEANDQMTQLRQKLEEGRKANLPTEDLAKLEDQLKSATKEAKQWNDAQRNLMRGVKALDEAIIQFNRGQGSVEKMSAALSKAARNAAQLQQSRMERGSQGWQEMEALITALDKNLVKARQDFDGLVQTIEAGGRVSVSELTQAKQSLKELSDLTAYGSDEWKGYDAQLQTIEKHISTLSQTERRLAGEIVTVEDARRRAAAADAEAARSREVWAQQELAIAKTEREAAEQREADSRIQIAATEQEIAKTKEQVEAQRQLIASLNELSDAEDKAGKEVDEARKKVKKAEEEWKPLRDAAWEAAKKVVELEAKLKELEAQPVKLRVDTSEIERLEAELKEAQRVLGNASAYEKLAQAKLEGMRSAHAEQGSALSSKRAKLNEFTSATYELQERKNELEWAIEPFSRRHRKGQDHFDINDIEQQRVAVEKLDEAFRMFHEREDFRSASLRRQYEMLGQYAFGYSDAERQFGSYERAIRSLGAAVEGTEAKFRLIFQGAGVDKSFQGVEFLDGYISRRKELAQLSSEIKKNLGDTDIDKLASDVQSETAIFDENAEKIRTQEKEVEQWGKLKKEYADKVAEAEKKLSEAQQQATDITQSSVDVDKQKAEVQQQLAEAQQKLNEAKAAAEGPTKALKEADEAYAEAQKKEQEAMDALSKARENMNLGEEEQKLEALERKYDDLTESLNKQKQAGQDLAQARQKEQEAAIELAQAQNQSEEGLKKSVEVLEQQNKTLEAGSAEWQENEQAIGKLNKRIEELKQQSQELRGEVMSLAEAEELANKAMEEQARTTKTGWAAGTEELKRAEQTLADKVAKAKRGTAEEEAAYQKLVRQLQAVRTELSAGSMSGKQMMDILANPKNVTSVDTLKAAIGRARQELDALGRRIDQARMDGHTKEAKELADAYDDIAEGAKNADQRMKELQAQSKGTASAFDKAWSRLKTYVGLYVGAAVAMQKLTAAMGDLLELSDRMGEVRKTTGFTADEVGRLSGNLAKLDTRTTLTQLMELSSLAGSVGLKTQQDVQGFTEAADQLIVALPELGNESARTIIKIANATGDLEKNGGNVRETLEKVGSTIIALRANSASAAGPITDFVSRVGAVGAQAGISIDQIAALGSTIDALGGRVEMSATALSRMIPAIKNNSFAIANSIGVTEKYLKSLTPMEQMVLIFQKMRDNIAGIDTTTEQGQEQMAATIEGMLGKNATMREVMKDLEQQGARAGIVFGLLSQNVDELEKQLGIASEAYRENTALANEFNNMNETTAAKWERLKNQFEEFFVGDRAQRILGWIIDKLRDLADILTEDGPIGSFFRWSLIYLALWKAKWAEAIGSALISMGEFLFSTEASTAATVKDTAAKTANTVATGAQAVATEAATVKTNMFAVAWGKLNKVQKANVIAALATAIVALGWKLWDAAQKAKAAAKQLDVLTDVEKKAKEESVKQRAELERLYRVTQDQTNSMEERKKALREMVGDAKYKEYYENLTTESELASAAASAYKELAAEIIATARARALDAKAEELQSKRIKLEDERRDREEWEDENRGRYRQGRQEYQQRQQYAAGATSGISGFQESQIAQRGAAEAKPAIIDEFEGSIRERNRIDSEIAQIDKDLARVEEQVKKMKPQGSAAGSGSGSGGNGGGTNPYGSYNRVTSPYQDWDADALVSRRKEMLERVRALANGADVQAVLSEDAKFIAEATRNNIKTTKDAIEWYNTERLKIQEALHEKHLTNTGDWMDPTGRKKREKTIKDEWSAYLNELDAYYTERKTRIQEAATEEGITEAEMKNRTLANEMEWHQRRAELQKLYARKSGEVTEEEQQAIFDILSERTGDTADFIQKTIGKTVKFIYDIGKHSEAEMRSIFGKLDKGIERDFLKQQQAVTTQMKAIRDIIEKERPYDGITANLRENLVTMGILTADMTAERNRLMRENADRSDFNSRQAAEELKRTAFLLGEAENAYSTTIEEVLRHMGEQGMQAWADAIRGDTQMQQALMAQLRTAYDEIQNAIKKEASLIKKQTDIWWADIAEGQTQSRRDGFEKALSRLGLAEDQVKRANSLIGAGQASERVADKLAIKQMQVRLAMQMTYYNRMRQIGEERIAQLKAEGRLEDAEHLRRSLNLAKTEELKKLEEQRVAIANQMEESQNRLYTELREWGDLVASSLQGVFEASNTGQADFYTEQAKKRLTGESTSGLYIVVENAGTADAKASYQTLSDQEVLDIEQRNAMADAWKKLMDDLNMKMSETITDQLNAMVQNVSIDANTNALYANTQAVLGLTGAMETEKVLGTGDMGVDENGVPNALKAPEAEEYDFGSAWRNTEGDGSGWDPETNSWVVQAEASTAAKETILQNQQDIAQGQVQTDTKIQKSTQSAFAKMTAAANLYGVAYQVMSNSNMSASQKAGMIAIQAAGNAAITGLNVAMSEAAARAATDSPGVLGKLWKTLGPVGASAMFAVFTGLLGGLMGLATSKIQKSKSEVAQATGVSASAGRLATGMLTYAEGNVNEFTDPATLREGRQYNVDAADGRTYRARYMGRNPKTHLTNGPEFHLSGERGREMIIDAGTTRQITMNEAEIWHAIQTLSGGGSARRFARRGRGVRAFADGNVEDFVDVGGDTIAAQGSSFDPAAMQASLDRNSAVQEALLERLSQPIQAEVSPYGPRGIVAGYDKAKKDAQRYGVKY